jgi:hypothetical protein
MNKKLTQSLSVPESMPTVEQLFTTLKESQKVLSQSFKSELSYIKAEISQLKSDLKQQKSDFLSKIDFILQSNKESEETIRNFHKIITETTQKSLNSIKHLKDSQTTLFHQISLLSSSSTPDMPKRRTESLSSKPLLPSFSPPDQFPALSSQLSLLTTKVNYLYAEFSSFDLKSYFPLITSMKAEIDAEITALKSSKSLLPSPSTISRFEILEDFISAQRKDLFSALDSLTSRLSKAESLLHSLLS